MTGYPYHDPEPLELCPYCSMTCYADFVDVGVGFTQCGPFHCTACGASEIGPCDDERPLTAREKKTGWYGPGKPAGSSANVDRNGNIVSHWEADTQYRLEQGVAARYDSNGKFLK